MTDPTSTPPGRIPATIPPMPDPTMPTLYVIKVAGLIDEGKGLAQAWVKLDTNTRLPRFTFSQPQGLSFADAMNLMRQADITCGGTLRLVRVEG
jgi:hypothetical protein